MARVALSGSMAYKQSILKRLYGQIWRYAPACSGNHCRQGRCDQTGGNVHVMI